MSSDRDFSVYTQYGRLHLATNRLRTRFTIPPGDAPRPYLAGEPVTAGVPPAAVEVPPRDFSVYTQYGGLYLAIHRLRKRVTIPPGDAPLPHLAEEPVPPTDVEVPPTDVEVPPTTVEVPPTTVEVPPTTVEVPPTSVEAPPTAVEAPPTAVEVQPAPPTAEHPPPEFLPDDIAEELPPRRRMGPITPDEQLAINEAHFLRSIAEDFEAFENEQMIATGGSLVERFGLLAFFSPEATNRPLGYFRHQMEERNGNPRPDPMYDNMWGRTQAGEDARKAAREAGQDHDMCRRAYNHAMETYVAYGTPLAIGGGGGAAPSDPAPAGGEAPPDAAPPDAAPPDAAPPDAAPPDAAPPDSAPPDSAPPDSAPPDAAPPGGDGANGVIDLSIDQPGTSNVIEVEKAPVLPVLWIPVNSPTHPRLESRRGPLMTALGEVEEQYIEYFKQGIVNSEIRAAAKKSAGEKHGSRSEDTADGSQHIPDALFISRNEIANCVIPQNRLNFDVSKFLNEPLHLLITDPPSSNLSIGDKRQARFCELVWQKTIDTLKEEYRNDVQGATGDLFVVNFSLSRFENNSNTREQLGDFKFCINDYKCIVDDFVPQENDDEGNKQRKINNVKRVMARGIRGIKFDQMGTCDAGGPRLEVLAAAYDWIRKLLARDPDLLADYMDGGKWANGEAGSFTVPAFAQVFEAVKDQMFEKDSGEEYRLILGCMSPDPINPENMAERQRIINANKDLMSSYVIISLLCIFCECLPGPILSLVWLPMHMDDGEFITFKVPYDTEITPSNVQMDLYGSLLRMLPDTVFLKAKNYLECLKSDNHARDATFGQRLVSYPTDEDYDDSMDNHLYRFVKTDPLFPTQTHFVGVRPFVKPIVNPTRIGDFFENLGGVAMENYIHVYQHIRSIYALFNLNPYRLRTIMQELFIDSATYEDHTRDIEIFHIQVNDDIERYNPLVPMRNIRNQPCINRITVPGVNRGRRIVVVNQNQDFFAEILRSLNKHDREGLVLDHIPDVSYLSSQPADSFFSVFYALFLDLMNGLPNGDDKEVVPDWLKPHAMGYGASSMTPFEFSRSKKFTCFRGLLNGHEFECPIGSLLPKKFKHKSYWAPCMQCAQRGKTNGQTRDEIMRGVSCKGCNFAGESFPGSVYLGGRCSTCSLCQPCNTCRIKTKEQILQDIENNFFCEECDFVNRIRDYNLESLSKWFTGSRSFSASKPLHIRLDNGLVFQCTFRNNKMKKNDPNEAIFNVHTCSKYMSFQGFDLDYPPRRPNRDFDYTDEWLFDFFMRIKHCVLYDMSHPVYNQL